MTADAQLMKVTIEDRGFGLRDALRERLDRVARLRCAEHGDAVFAVAIHGRENGWFDSLWVTCCEAFEQQADSIVKRRL